MLGLLGPLDLDPRATDISRSRHGR